MATGKKAFEGKTSASVMAKILEANPPSMLSAQPVMPPALDHLVRRCLAKEPDERWQAASDLYQQLKWIAEGGSQAGVPAPAVAQRRSRQWMVWASVAAAVIVAALVASFAYFRGAPAAGVAPVRFSVGPPEKGFFLESPNFLSVSPDGSKLAFIASDTFGTRQLWIRSLDSAAAQSLAGTDNPGNPFWSPDSRFVGFWADGNLKKIAVSGGPAQTLVERVGQGAAGSWNRDGVIVFDRTPVDGAAIHRVSAAGGTATPVLPLDAERQENDHFWPYFLPDGKHFLFFARSAKPENSAIYVGSLDSKERTFLLNATSNPVYVPPGYLLFNRGGTLMAQPFDAARMQLSGEAVPIAEGLQFNFSNGLAAFAASDNGVLAYRAAGAAAPRSLVWVSRNGTEQLIPAPSRDYQQPRLSPDGRRVAVEINEDQPKVWLYDLGRETLTRLTFEGSRNDLPIWTPDGKRTTLRSTQDNPVGNIFWQMADGSGGRERLTTSDTQQSPSSWSPDGQRLAFTDIGSATGRDIWVLSLADRKAQPFLSTPFVEGAPEFSPDGRWLAYVSNESGRFEVYVQPYPGPGGKWQISAGGGAEPKWNPNGRELFYRSGSKMMAVDVAMQPGFSAGTPKMLFDTQYVSTPLPQTFQYYDVSRDGQRFLMVRQGEQAPTQISVVLNWLAELNRGASGRQ
jgi:Tol biopolymer transport system component